MARIKFPSAYTISGYLLKAAVLVLIVIFILLAIKSMGPLIHLEF